MYILSLVHNTTKTNNCPNFQLTSHFCSLVVIWYFSIPPNYRFVKKKFPSHTLNCMVDMY